MVKLLNERAARGRATIRVIGSMKGGIGGYRASASWAMRLHVRAIVRDGTRAFVGSQSLRTLELTGAARSRADDHQPDGGAGRFSRCSTPTGRSRPEEDQGRGRGRAPSRARTRSRQERQGQNNGKDEKKANDDKKDKKQDKNALASPSGPRLLKAACSA